MVARSGRRHGSTVVERNLDRITIGVAFVFTFATLALDLRFSKAMPRVAAGSRWRWSSLPWRAVLP